MDHNPEEQSMMLSLNENGNNHGMNNMGGGAGGHDDTRL